VQAFRFKERKDDDAVRFMKVISGIVGKDCAIDPHGCGKRFIVRVDEILTAFLELERAIHAFAVSLVL